MGKTADMLGALNYIRHIPIIIIQGQYNGTYTMSYLHNLFKGFIAYYPINCNIVYVDVLNTYTFKFHGIGFLQ